MQVVFTQIDDKDPLMPFYFFLTLSDSSRKYIGMATISLNIGSYMSCHLICTIIKQV